jgi:biopolymer transport protein ExbD
MHSEVHTSAMNDIMFFLMLFFLIVSTLANPSVIKVMLPHSSQSQSVSKHTVSLTVDKDKHYFIDNDAVAYEALETTLAAKLKGQPDPTVTLRADNTLTVQDIVDLISIGNKLKVKMILATKNSK